MTGSKLSSDGLDTRRKRLLFRCWHRGTRELDLIVGRFADAHLAALSDAELDQLEKIVEAPDPELYAALTGDGPPPIGVAGPLFDKMKSFRAADRGL
jgi:antitoxin CptB